MWQDDVVEEEYDDLLENDFLLGGSQEFSLASVEVANLFLFPRNVR